VCRSGDGPEVLCSRRRTWWRVAARIVAGNLGRALALVNVPYSLNNAQDKTRGRTATYIIIFISTTINLNHPSAYRHCLAWQSCAAASLTIEWKRYPAIGPRATKSRAVRADNRKDRAIAHGLSVSANHHDGVLFGWAAVWITHRGPNDRPLQNRGHTKSELGLSPGASLWVVRQ
jgi:hypothetical protein